MDMLSPDTSFGAETIEVSSSVIDNLSSDTPSEAAKESLGLQTRNDDLPSDSTIGTAGLSSDSVTETAGPQSGFLTETVSSTSSVSNGKTEINDDIWNKLELINDDRNERENIHEIEVKSGELIVLESERRKEKEFLGSVYKKIESCLASLNGDKNMCRNELRKIKKMIQEYVESLN